MSAVLISFLLGLALAAVAAEIARRYKGCANRYREACIEISNSPMPEFDARVASNWILARGEDRETLSFDTFTRYHLLHGRFLIHGKPRRPALHPLPQRRASDRQAGCFHLSLLQNLALVALVPLAIFGAQQLDPGPTAAQAERDVHDEVLAVQAYEAEPAGPVEGAVVAGLQPLVFSTAR